MRDVFGITEAEFLAALLFAGLVAALILGARLSRRDEIDVRRAPANRPVLDLAAARAARVSRLGGDSRLARGSVRSTSR